MLTDHGNSIAILDRQITHQLCWEAAQRHLSTTPSSLTDSDLQFIGKSAIEMRSEGSSDARYGDAARYPKCRSYMNGYRHRQMQMQRDNQGPHCILPLREGDYFAWGA